jgi:NADH dehydrogenase
MPKRADASGASGDNQLREKEMSESLGISRPQSGRPHVVIIGGGFAGIAAAKALRHCEADVTIIDRRNHHIFQPLLYQVATAVRTGLF